MLCGPWILQTVSKNVVVWKGSGPCGILSSKPKTLSTLRAWCQADGALTDAGLPPAYLGGRFSYPLGYSDFLKDPQEIEHVP